MESVHIEKSILVAFFIIFVLKQFELIDQGRKVRNTIIRRATFQVTRFGKICATILGEIGLNNESTHFVWQL